MQGASALLLPRMVVSKDSSRHPDLVGKIDANEQGG
jgi:hypothetical protein